MAPRSALRPIFGRRIDGAAGAVVDMAAVIGTVFGVATTLGIVIVVALIMAGLLWLLATALSA